MKLSRAIALMALIAVLVGVSAMAGCSEGSSRSVPSQQQGVSDVLQEQAQGSKSSGQGASSGASQGGSFTPDSKSAYAKVDYDLTSMGPDMVYATVYDMMVNPSTYEGKVVRMSGTYYHTRNDVTGNDYFFVVIQDATACCSQGLEFVWGDGSHVWPQDYPEDGNEVTVTGVFEVYTEGTVKYIHLVHASPEEA